MIPMKHNDNNKPAQVGGMELSGLGHVSRKGPMPRPAPQNMLSPSNQNLANGNMGGLGMSSNQIRNLHPPGTSQNHISAMQRHMSQGKNFKPAHNLATEQGFPAKRRGIGMSLPSSSTVGLALLLMGVTGGSYYFYQRRNLRDELAEEEDDSE